MECCSGWHRYVILIQALSHHQQVPWREHIGSSRELQKAVSWPGRARPAPAHSQLCLTAKGRLKAGVEESTAWQCCQHHWHWNYLQSLMWQTHWQKSICTGGITVQMPFSSLLFKACCCHHIRSSWALVASTVQLREVIEIVCKKKMHTAQ